MKQKKEHIKSNQAKCHGYLKNLNTCLKRIENDFEELYKIDDICESEWCKEIGVSLDEVAKSLYSIKSPGWVADDYSRTVRNMRLRLHELYIKQHEACAHCNMQ